MAATGKIKNISHGETDKNGNSGSSNDKVTGHDQTNPLCNPATSSRKTFKHASLPRLELLLSFVYVIFCIVYIKYRCTVISQDNIKVMRRSYFTEGWIPYNTGLRDNSDYEWRFWKTHMMTWDVLYLVVAYIVLGRLVDFIMPDLRKLFILSFGLAAMALSMSPSLVLFFIGHTAVAYIGSLTRRKWVIWLIAVLQTASIFANLEFYWWQKSYLPGLNNVVVQLTFSILRYLSFGLECCNKEEKVKDYGLMDLLVYNFYFPLFMGGPIMTFDKFQEQINKPAGQLTSQNWWNIFKNILRYLMWFCYVEVFQHFCYYAAFHKHPTLFSNLPPQDYPVLASWHLMFFQNKYVVFYGFPCVLAMFDRIEVPGPPACILSLYTFRDMWRYFDRGIHTIIMRYIYFPLGGSKFGLFWSSLGAFTAFSFMALWHGNSYKMYSWAFCNWLGIQIETVVIGLSWTQQATEFQKRFSGPMLRRICAFVAVFNYMFLTVSNMIFLAGYPNFWSYIRGIFIHGFPLVTLVVVGFLYFNIQLIMEVQRRYSMDFIYNKKYI